MKLAILEFLLRLLIGAVILGSVVGYCYLVYEVSKWFLLLIVGVICWGIGNAFTENL